APRRPRLFPYTTLFRSVRARRHPRADSMRLAAAFADLLGPLRCSEEEHLTTGLELWSRYESLGAFGAVLAAVALDSKYATLVSRSEEHTSELQSRFELV